LDPLTLFKMAVESITAHKLRSFLVTLGILIGVTAVLVNAALVQGFRVYFDQQIQALGSNFVTIQPGSAYGLLGTTTKEDDLLAPSLYDSVRRLPYVDEATASRTAFGTVKYMGEEVNVLILGTEPGYLDTINREMLTGEPLTVQDSFNAVLGSSIQGSFAQQTLALMSHFGLTVTVNNQEVSETFRVKGIVEESQPGFGMGIVYVPIRTLNSMLGNEGYGAIVLTTADDKYVATIKAEAQQMLNRLLKVRAEQPLGTEGESEAILGFLPAPFQAHSREYKITTQEDILAISDSISSMIQLVLVAIAGISLLVGGIGIANVMLVTVSERTREIGVMKAVGAKNRHVAIAFLFEACVIGLLGGILGMAIATAFAFTAVPLLFDVPGSFPLQWAGIAISICLAISLLSGLYPALRASSMDPVEALRSE